MSALRGRSHAGAWQRLLGGLAAAAIAALAGCAGVPTRSLYGPVADVPADVSAPSLRSLSAVYASESGRVATVDRVWQLVADRFYDPQLRGVDWSAAGQRARLQAADAMSDAELYRALKQMVASLGDSHTGVLTPREVVDRRAYAGARVGLFLTVADNRVVLRDVEPDSPAAQAGLRRGDMIAAANGVALDAEFVRQAQTEPAGAAEPGGADVQPMLPADAQDAARGRVLRAVRRVLRPNEALQPLVLDIVRDPAAPARRVTLTPTTRVQTPIVEHRWLDNKVLVIRFTRFAPEVRAGLARALEDAQEARAIVVDLRGNGGGQVAMFQWFAGHFVAESREAFRLLRRDAPGGRTQIATPLRITAREPYLRQPLAVLIDNASGSAAELTALALAEARGALLVGEPSCGCATSVRTEYVLPDHGGVRIAEDGFVSMRGLRLEGEPLVPGVRVTPSLAELRSGRDVVLDAAVRSLLRPRSAERIPGAAARLS